MVQVERLPWACICFWALSVQPEVRIDCMEHMSLDNSNLWKLIDEVISWLHLSPCPNRKMVNKGGNQIIDIFWKAFKHFMYKTGALWNHGTLAGKSHIWHEMNSLPYKEVIGLVSCTSYQSALVLDQQSNLGVTLKWSWTRKGQIWKVHH